MLPRQESSRWTLSWWTFGKAQIELIDELEQSSVNFALLPAAHANDGVGSLRDHVSMPDPFAAVRSSHLIDGIEREQRLLDIRTGRNVLHRGPSAARLGFGRCWR